MIFLVVDLHDAQIILLWFFLVQWSHWQGPIYRETEDIMIEFSLDVQKLSFLTTLHGWIIYNDVSSHFLIVVLHSQGSRIGGTLTYTGELHLIWLRSLSEHCELLWQDLWKRPIWAALEFKTLNPWPWSRFAETMHNLVCPLIFMCNDIIVLKHS